MDFHVAFLDENEDILKEEHFVGVASLAALLLQLSRQWDLTENVAGLLITRQGGIDG